MAEPVQRAGVRVGERDACPVVRFLVGRNFEKRPRNRRVAPQRAMVVGEPDAHPLVGFENRAERLSALPLE